MMFIRELNLEKLEQHVPEFTLIHAPNFHANPEIDGTGSEAFVLLHFQKRLILIGGRLTRARSSKRFHPENLVEYRPKPTRFSDWPRLCLVQSGRLF